MLATEERPLATTADGDIRGAAYRSSLDASGITDHPTGSIHAVAVSRPQPRVRQQLGPPRVVLPTSPLTFPPPEDNRRGVAARWFPSSMADGARLQQVRRLQLLTADHPPAS